MNSFPQIGWGEAKAEINLLVHAIPFSAAVAVLRDPDRLVVGRDGPDGSTVTVGTLDGRVVTVATQLIEGTVRIVSARRATAREWQAAARPEGNGWLGEGRSGLSPAQASRFDAMSAADHRRNAQADPDNPPLGPADLARAEAGRHVRRLRVGSGLSADDFAAHYRFDRERLLAWEAARETPDMAVLAYLTVIAREPEAVSRALGAGPHRPGRDGDDPPTLRRSSDPEAVKI